MVNQPNSNDEVVKCVVVGDSGVGKTCLVCAFACNTHYDLKKLVRTHVATVWAIDHYQRDREVLERSWCEVDGVQVSLRLWDTFGYHDKDRRFAYRGADVIVLCFSTVRPSSLRNVKTIWYPEIRHFCPTIPIILVGTQADMRYLYNDEHYLQIEKGLMYRHISEKDIITPTVGHEMAKDIGAPFYESSVLAKFGVNDIFINSIRAALIERRKVRFWNTQLRRVQRPLIQPPMILPPPTMPKVILVPPSPRTGIASLLSNHREGDVTFIARGHCLEAHKIVLAISSRFFKELFSCEQVIKIPPHHQHILQTELLQALKFQSQSMSSENEHLLDNDQAISPEAISNILVMNSSAAKTRNISMNTYPLTISFKHQAFESVEVRYQEDAYNSVQMCLRLFIILHSDITARAFQLVLEFLYCNQICMVANPEIAQEVRRAAELLEIKELLSGLENLRVGEGFLNTSLLKQLQQEKQEKLWKLAHSEESFLPDVTFQVDDGLVSAHKALLMAGCEMMNAMFSNHFLESSADVISFPGLNCETFRVLLEYIYTGEVVNFASADCASLIVTANQLCQPHLVSLVEVHVVSELQRTDVKGFDRVEEALFLLEHAELHNAKQLARWCEKFLCIHYREVTQLHGKMFRSLPKERQEAIERFRWPPVWYLKEIERFERQTHNSIHHPEQRQRQDYNRCFTGCLCFTRRGRHRLNDPVELPI